MGNHCAMNRFDEPERPRKDQRSDQSPTHNNTRYAEKRSRQTSKLHAAHNATGPQGEGEKSSLQ
jgi:hypothetical protein